MMLHFLRHAQAEPFNRRMHGQDRDRLLSQAGREQIRLAAQGFMKEGMRFDTLISSPYPRAVETAKIVADVFKFKKAIHFSENLIPEALYHKFRKEFLANWTKSNSVLIVTHQPFVSECISILLSGKEDPLLSVNMGTGALCSLEIDARWKSPAILSAMIPSEMASRMGLSR